MKKMIIGMLVGMAVMSCAGFVGYTTITKNYEAKLEETKTEYETQISKLEDKYTKLETSNTELEEQVYNMMEGDSYDIAVNHDGTLYSYKCERDGKGIFGELKHYVKTTIK